MILQMSYLLSCSFIIFFSTRAATKILISYSKRIGIETITCEIRSGGVIAAEMINIPTIECFRYLRKKAGVIIPSRVKIYVTTGSKKSKPE